MDDIRRIIEVYRFPGFRPLGRVRRADDDDGGVVVALERRRKKRSVDVAGRTRAVGTISVLDWFETWRAAIGECFSRFRFAGLIARGAAE